MTTALDRGDLDEVARQGALAGPAEVARALGRSSRDAVLAAIVAAPAVEDRAELLPDLARVAGGPDRRTAIPAAHAALAIARELAAHDLPDDLAPADVDAWRGDFEAIARAPDHFVEVRLVSLDVANVLGGFDRAALAADRDPAVRAEAAALAP